MVVVMEERASEDQIQHVVAQLTEKGFDVHRSTGQLRSVLGAVGGNRAFDTRLIEVMDGVHEVLRITEPYKLASRTFKPEDTSVAFDDFRVANRGGEISDSQEHGVHRFNLGLDLAIDGSAQGIQAPVHGIKFVSQFLGIE